MVAFTRFAQLVVEQFEQALLGLAPAQPAQQIGAERGLLFSRGKGLVEGEQMGVVRILGLARQLRVGDDAGDGVLELLGAAEQRDGVVVALGHLAPVQARQGRHILLDHRLRQGEQLAPLAEQVVEALADVAGHLHVLDLVAADRHLVGVEHQDVGGHQHRVAEQAHGHAGVRVFAGLDVLVHRRLVGVGAVEQTLARHAGEQPGQLGDFGDVRLAIEGRAIGIQAAGQPGGGNFQARALDACRVVALDQRVVVGQEVEGIHVGGTAGDDRRADGAGVVAQVRGAGGGDAGKDARGHVSNPSNVWQAVQRRVLTSSLRSVSLPWKKWPHSATFSSSWGRARASDQA